ncbi:MAG: NAD-dependent epimerase/dehydratase family protein [Chthoniobacterales bacterium]
MPRVLIAGCGYVGLATAELFHRDGWDVEGWTGLAESAEALAAQPFPVRAVDLTARSAVERHASEFEAVIQSASSRGGGADAYRKIYLESAQHLRAVFPEALHLFTSSTSVYAQSDGEWVTEESPAEPERETGRVLRATEEFVLEGGGIVARLAGIYGPSRSALLRKFLEGTAVIDPNADRFVNQIHRDDLAAGLVLLARKHLGEPPVNDSRDRRIFNVADNHPTSLRQCYEWLAQRLERPLPPKQTSVEERRRGNSNKRVSSARLQALGWEPRYPTFEIAMNQSILPAKS